MSLNLSAAAVRERAVTLFFILLLAAAGAYAFLMLGRAEDPSFTIKTLTVTTVWPGATAREMQDLVAEPLEKRLQELTWYDRVETTTRPGYAYMTVTLKDSTPPSSVQEEFYQARKKLGDEARNLPPGALGPFVNDEYSDVSFALYALKAKGMPMRELARKAEVIRQDLLHVPGVKKVNILGERPEQIFVEFSFAKLATLGVSAQDIVAGLQRQNTVTPAGSIDTRARKSSSGSMAPTTVSRRSPTRRSSLRGERSSSPTSPRSAAATRIRRPISSDIRVSPRSCSRQSCRRAGTVSRSARRWKRSPQPSHGHCRSG
jgi:multidrug efflux pump subunit AcrB